jgi:GNAT superfamily N-acetyltransferase/catechol 2,3-dioxygenase-like lactoylglutathione lyase family enzyme
MADSQSARTHLIERLALPVSDADIRALAHLLVDAVDSGAAVSFLAPLTVERAEAWWRHTISTSDPRAIFLVARDDSGIVGTVQVHPAWAPNQPHRAEVVKLIVHRRGRRSGLGAHLMQAIEDAGRRAGFRLLTLDAKRGEAAERLYRRLGWTPAGAIPEFALDSDGTPHDAVIFYKDLQPPSSKVSIFAAVPQFTVPDLVRTAEYYRDVLGFEIAGYWDGERASMSPTVPPVFAIVRRDQIQVFFNRARQLEVRTGRADNGYDAYFRVTGLNALAAELRARGADILDGPEDRVYRQREIVVRDCNGLVLAFGEELAGD